MSVGQVVEDLLFKLNKEESTTLIIVTHDDELASRCRTVIDIRDGKLKSVGTGRKVKK